MDGNPYFCLFKPVDMPSPEQFALLLIDWYRRHKRDLPWRDITDPYRIWLSEVILQQTRVQQGLPYYERFVSRFPTVQDLAAATEQDVLRLWQGLGYYSRARNMHHTARVVVEKWGGAFPTRYADLLQLKGVGTYTAAAIASFSSGEAVAVVDGNVFRVLARVFGLAEDIASPKGKKAFQQLATELLPATQAAEYNQAIMEFGTLHCKPQNPDCMFCIFSADCEARRTGRQEELPIKLKKIVRKTRFFHYFVLEYDGKLLMSQRPAGDIWQGLYDFPMVESTAMAQHTQDWYSLKELGTNCGALLAKEWLCEGDTLPVTLRHQLTHQQIEVGLQHWKMGEQAVGHLQATTRSALFTIEQIKELPKPILIQNYLEANFY